MKKIATILSIFTSFFVGGCSQTFEVVELRNHEMDPFLEEYNIDSVEVEKYRFGNVLLSTYFTQNPLGGYDLRLSVWSETKDEKVTIINTTIVSLDKSNLEIDIVAEQEHIDSGLFLGHKVLIDQIAGDELFELGSQNREVEVNISGKRNDEVRTFSYFFTAKKKRVAAPLH